MTSIDADIDTTATARTGRAAEIAGWYGAVAVLAAYAGATAGLDPDGAVFLLLNLTGSAGLAWVSARRHVRQNVVLNAVWMAVAVVGLARAAF